jgi:hypothetical protein
MKIRKALFMCIPEIDEKAQHSIYLKISEELARLAGVKPRIKFDLFKKTAKARIIRQQKRLQKAKKSKRPPRRIIIR